MRRIGRKRTRWDKLTPKQLEAVKILAETKGTSLPLVETETTMTGINRSTGWVLSEGGLASTYWTEDAEQIQLAPYVKQLAAGLD